ncbi:hypothetical protein Tco_0303815 [Tanacetum coccineum]
MKHWKSGFFLIDRRAILDDMVWRHPNATIDDPRPADGSFNMADVRRLSAHVINLRDMPEVLGIYDFLSLPEWTSAVVQEEPHLDVRSTLQRLPFYCTPLAVADLKASTYDVASSHVTKRTRSALTQSFDNTTQPNLFVGNSDDESNGDDDACVEIPLVTPLRSAAMIPPSGNQGRSSVAPLLLLLKALTPEGKGIMVDDVAAPSGGVSRQRPSSRPAPSFRDVSGDAIHTDFFPFFVGSYYATYSEDGVAGNYEFTREELDAPYRPTFGVLTKEVFKDLALCKTIVDQFPTPREMVRVKGLSDDQLTAKMSVLHCMMMSHGGKLLARDHGLNQSHYEYVLSIDSRLKGYEEKVAGLTRLELQVSTLKKQVYGLNDKLANSNASFAKSKANGKERKKKIKSLLKATPSEFSSFFRGQFQGLVQKFLASDEFSRVQGKLLSLATSFGFERGLSMHRTKDEFADMLKKMVNFMPGAQERLAEASPLLKPEKLVRLANVPIPRDTRVSPPITKESTVTPVSKSLKLSANVILASSAVSLEQNEEQVSAAIDGSNLEMIDGAANSKSGGSKRVSSGLTDVVVALSAGEKGDGSAPFTVEKFGFALGALLVALPFLMLLVSSIDGLVLIPTDTSWLRNSSL